MAVPASGSISLGGLAFEKLEDEYNDGLPSAIDTSYGPFSLKDITIGGNSSGVGGETYDSTNGFSPYKPDNVASYGMSEFYSYDHDHAGPGCNLTYHLGGQGTFSYPVNLGSSTGTVTIEYQSYSVPDRFVFVWNGNTYTSGSGNGTGAGYVGNNSYLSQLQATEGNSSATITEVTGSYGTATAKKHADTTWTQAQIDDASLVGTAPDGADTNTVRLEGLKTVLIRNVKAQAEGELNQTDWYVTRKSEKSTAIPSAITTHRDAVRSKQVAMITAITNASDTPALETLYTYVRNEDETVTRPLGVIPTLE